MSSGKFAHLAGADNENRLPFQRSEDLLREFHGHRRDRHGRRPDGGLAAHALGYGKGAAKELVELSANGADGAGRGIGFLDLAENLGFADYHRIQAGGYAKEVANRIFPTEFVEMRVELFRLQMKVIVQESAEVGGAVGGVRHKLNTIAGGDHHALFDPGIGGEITASVGQARFRNR